MVQLLPIDINHPATPMMPTVSIFEPRPSPDGRTVLDHIRIAAYHAFVWQLLVSARDPIIRENMIFQIRMPNVMYPIWAQLGPVVMCDWTHTVYRLVTHHADCPPTVLIAHNDAERFVDITQLTPVVPATPMTYTQ